MRSPFLRWWLILVSWVFPQSRSRGLACNLFFILIFSRTFFRDPVTVNRFQYGFCSRPRDLQRFALCCFLRFSHSYYKNMAYRWLCFLKLTVKWEYSILHRSMFPFWLSLILAKRLDNSVLTTYCKINRNVNIIILDPSLWNMKYI